MAISYALSITSLLSGLLQAFTETEKEMVAVERINDYVENVPKEKFRGTIKVIDWQAFTRCLYAGQRCLGTTGMA